MTRTDKVFVIVPVHSTSVRKDGVPPISFCVPVFVTKFSVTTELFLHTQSLLNDVKSPNLSKQRQCCMHEN